MKKEKIKTDFNNFYNFSTDYFTLIDHPCQCAIDKITNEDGTISYLFKAKRKSEDKIYFAFGSKAGLCLTTEHGSIQENNVLTGLLSIKKDEDLLSFFEKHGFLFKLSNKQFVSFDLTTIHNLIDRLGVTVDLMSAVSAPNPNYDLILKNTLFLLFANELSINEYKSNKGKLVSLLEEESNVFEIDGESERFEKRSYTIKDYFAPNGTYELSSDWYDQISKGNFRGEIKPGEDDIRFKKIVRLYRNARNESKNNRLIIDFMFHYMHDVGIVKSIQINKKKDVAISYYNSIDESAFTPRLKNLLLQLAKLTIAEEINHNIDEIKPFYSFKDMQPTWKAGTLLSALYFSLFYMSPESEIYRKCKNPSCSNSFLVKTSNSRKQYCCSKCRNANAQRTHRKKEQKKKGLPFKVIPIIF